jgi:methionyl-tRNA formyltransferase
MRVVFFGTGNFGIPTLKGLLRSTHAVAAAVTRPDVRKGRGWNVLPTPVKEIAEKVAPGMMVLQPEKLTDEGFLENLRNLNADVFVVVDYGKILPPDLLEMPEKYCINLHPSLLPLYRGAAPVSRAIMNGDKVTGNTVIKMNERMDAGDVIVRESLDIEEHDTSDVLENKLSLRGSALVLRALDLLASGRADLERQDESLATYAPKLEKAEGKIDWSMPASEIALRVRGLQPWPGAYTYLNGKVLKVIQASRCVCPEGDFAFGEVLQADTRMAVKAREGALRVSKLQLEGKKAMTSDEFLMGHQRIKGMVLG